MQVRIGDIAALVGGDLVGDPALTVHRIATLESAGPEAVAFLANPRYAPQLGASRAGCVLVAPAMRDAAAARGAAIVCADPYLAYARLTQWWAGQLRGIVPGGVHVSAVVEAGAIVDPSASVGALAIVGAGAVVEAGAVVGAGAQVGVSAHVGAQTRLQPRAVLGERCRIGARGIVHSGAVIGADGFGFAPDGGRWVKIEQLGAVTIGDDVEIGANTCIDRGALDDTLIGDGVKLDNLIQVGHNVRIGDHTAIAGCVGIAGSARIGRHCTIGGGALINGHIEIADHVHVTGGSAVTRSIPQPGRYTGYFPLDRHDAWEENAAVLRRLARLRERMRALENAQP